MMSIITKREVIRGVKHRFLEQYETYRDSYVIGPPHSQSPVGDIKQRLAALDLETCSEADVDAAMGGVTGWASLRCDECGKDSDAIARIGAEPDYEARWQDLCIDCIERARAMLAHANAPETAS
jgi:hypothetical protein